MADTARRKGRAVPLTTRLLAARPVRTAAGALGVGLALMLILLLSGLWEGVQQRVTVYEDHLGAGLVVVPPGTESLFADPGALSAAAAGAIRRTPGVAAADPVRTLYLILELPHGKAAVAAVASDPGRPGDPWALAAGRPPSGGRRGRPRRRVRRRAQPRHRRPAAGPRGRWRGGTLRPWPPAWSTSLARTSGRRVAKRTWPPGRLPARGGCREGSRLLGVPRVWSRDRLVMDHYPLFTDFEDWVEAQCDETGDGTSRHWT